MAENRLPDTEAAALASVYLPLAAWIVQRAGVQPAPFVAGINGAQGSGKSTLVELLGLILREVHGRRVASFSVDDIYLTRQERETLSRTVHPLLATRGVPGTHDVELGLATLDHLISATDESVTPIPAFDKAVDDRRPLKQWQQFRGRPDIILFEGWCLGTSPQSMNELNPPINILEEQEDITGEWRGFVNDQLASRYAGLFSRLDCLIFISVPDMESVFEWRSLQESKLAMTRSDDGHQIMDDKALNRFIMHYERLTRHNLLDLPTRADISLHLDKDHRYTRIAIKTDT